MKLHDLEGVENAIDKFLARWNLWNGMYDRSYIERFFSVYEQELPSITMALKDWQEMNEKRKREAFLGEGI